jgi:hypothetical protein
MLGAIYVPKGFANDGKEIVIVRGSKVYLSSCTSLRFGRRCLHFTSFRQ